LHAPLLPRLTHVFSTFFFDYPQTTSLYTLSLHDALPILNAVHTKGCNWMALPSTSVGWKACIPRRCSVGARLRSTGWPFSTFSNISHTTGSLRSTIFFADLTVFTMPRSIILRMINGL